MATQARANKSVRQRVTLRIGNSIEIRDIARMCLRMTMGQVRSRRMADRRQVGCRGR
jgi:hypothetical protein